MPEIHIRNGSAPENPEHGHSGRCHCVRCRSISLSPSTGTLAPEMSSLWNGLFRDESVGVRNADLDRDCVSGRDVIWWREGERPQDASRTRLFRPRVDLVVRDNVLHPSAHHWRSFWVYHHSSSLFLTCCVDHLGEYSPGNIQGWWDDTDFGRRIVQILQEHHIAKNPAFFKTGIHITSVFEPGYRHING